MQPGQILSVTWDDDTATRGLVEAVADVTTTGVWPFRKSRVTYRFTRCELIEVTHDRVWVFEGTRIPFEGVIGRNWNYATGEQRALWSCHENRRNRIDAAAAQKAEAKARAEREVLWTSQQPLPVAKTVKR